jgi:hypothetical protein
MMILKKMLVLKDRSERMKEKWERRMEVVSKVPRYGSTCQIGETMEIGADAEIRHTQFVKLVVYSLLCVDS